MSIKDYQKVIQIEDGTTGDIIICLDYSLYTYDTINGIISDLFWQYTMKDEHNLIIKLGYKR